MLMDSYWIPWFPPAFPIRFYPPHFPPGFFEIFIGDARDETPRAAGSLSPCVAGSVLSTFHQILFGSPLSSWWPLSRVFLPLPFLSGFVRIAATHGTSVLNGSRIPNPCVKQVYQWYPGFSSFLLAFLVFSSTPSGILTGWNFG